MEKQHFFIKLLAPRPTFTQDMTDAERAVMNEHIVYWKDLTDKRIAIIFGPVFDPQGGFGMGVVEVNNEEEAKAIMAKDPTITSGLNFGFEIYPMRIGQIRQ